MQESHAENAASLSVVFTMRTSIPSVPGGTTARLAVSTRTLTVLPGALRESGIATGTFGDTVLTTFESEEDGE